MLGAGKTSLALAIADTIGLNIHIVDLGDADVGDSDLQTLFNNLLRRSMILLGDIDATILG
jgi:Holliday junction resolvasome RuvABC ATP-dependent DNA helicase subunit